MVLMTDVVNPMLSIINLKIVLVEWHAKELLWEHLVGTEKSAGKKGDQLKY